MRQPIDERRRITPEPVIGPATSGWTRWANPPHALFAYEDDRVSLLAARLTTIIDYGLFTYRFFRRGPVTTEAFPRFMLSCSSIIS